MSNIDPGTYRGTSEGLTFEFRVECAAGGVPCVVSGDITRGPELVASFISERPEAAAGARTITGPLRFRGNPGLFTGTMYFNADERGIGTFQVAVDLEGGFRDIFAGRLDWQGSFLRRLTIEIDGIEGTQGPGRYATRGGGGAMSVARAFEQAGFDVQLIVDPFGGRAPDANRMRGYTMAEIHAAMSRRRTHVAPDRLHAHVFVCSYLAGRNNRNVLGVMYDFGSADRNQRPREGVAVFYDHPLLSDPRVPEQTRRREYVFTLVHEIGHALNLPHSFDKSKPAALSWMNYPNLYPRGYEAGNGHDGTQEFWRRFSEGFDTEEMRHLLHASPREIRAGGFPFGTYEEGTSTLLGGAAEPRRTRLGANPLRTARSVSLVAEPVKGEYDLGEPVFLRVGVRNDGPDAVHVPDALDPSEGYVRLLIRAPNGRVIRYRPPVRFCKQAQLLHLPAGAEQPAFEGLPLFLGADGPVFTEPGVYQVVAELTGVDGSKNVYSEAARVRVRPPDHATESFAYKLWGAPAALEALYLRHPLVAPDAWAEMEDELGRARLAPDNTTESYFNYVAGLGWMTPFAPPDKREKGSQRDKAVERFARVNPEGLPKSVAERQGRLLCAPATEPRAAARHSVAVATRPEESIRAEVSPSGLFGSIGLNASPRGGGAGPDGRPDPFVRIVPGRRGRQAFADIVSWNVEHLHRDASVWKIPKVAEVIQSFRCDFWGLREVDSTALARLTETLNSGGHTTYDFAAVRGAGRQSGAIYRTDTTSVSVVDPPPGFFRQSIGIEKAGGGREGEKVFPLAPLLCDVSVRQGGSKVFDFRCAVVHLQSADASDTDGGDALRLAAARELARWIRFERESGEEHDYIIMGDVNAETTRHGLRDFAGGGKLRLLSVGVRDCYGADALTRVASGRPPDHVVVTGEAEALTPAGDEKETLIVRHDTRVSDFTKSLSHHVPVAVRFVVGEDSY